MLRHLKLKINKLMFFKCRWWEIIGKIKSYLDEKWKLKNIELNVLSVWW